MNRIKLSLILALTLVTGNSVFGQYFTPAQINTIKISNSAFEGDMYRDTVNDIQYIGITNGALIRIGDTLDERIDSVQFFNDSLFIYLNNDSFYVPSYANIYLNNGTLSNDRVINGNNNSLVLNSLDSLYVDADSIYIRSLDKPNNEIFEFIIRNKITGRVNKIEPAFETFQSVSVNSVVLTNIPFNPLRMLSVYLNGQLLTNTLDYTLTNSSITFAFGVKTTDVISVKYYF
ncbi:MAG: hypothetical protein ABF240_11685 [Flavobacteriales bacterium]